MIGRLVRFSFRPVGPVVPLSRRMSPLRRLVVPVVGLVSATRLAAPVEAHFFHQKSGRHRGRPRGKGRKHA